MLGWSIMPDVVAELVRRIGKLETEVEELRARERFIAFDYDYMRGHFDDFLGDEDLFYRYTPVVVGAGSISMQDDRHGGQLRFRVGNTANDTSTLWLGDAADGHDTLDADEGWLQINRSMLEDVVDVRSRMGTRDVAINNFIRCGLATSFGANWILRTRTGGGAINTIDSGVAADTDWHWHVLDVYPITGGRQVDYYLDGVIIATTTVSVPTAVLTPFLQCQTLANDFTVWYVDFWGVIPRDLS